MIVIIHICKMNFFHPRFTYNYASCQTKFLIEKKKTLPTHANVWNEHLVGLTLANFQFLIHHHHHIC